MVVSNCINAYAALQKQRRPANDPDAAGAGASTRGSRDASPRPVPRIGMAAAGGASALAKRRSDSFASSVESGAAPGGATLDELLDSPRMSSRRPSQSEAEASRVRRLSQLGRLSQAGASPARRPPPGSTRPRASLVAQRTSLDSTRPISPPESEVSGTPVGGRSGFTPRMHRHRRPHWAREDTGGSGRHSQTESHHKESRKKESHQTYSAAWRETEALVDEYAALRDDYEQAWLGRAASDGARSPPARAVTVASQRAHAATTRHSPFVDAYRARSAAKAALLWADSDAGLAEAAAQRAEAADVRSTWIALVGEGAQEGLREGRQQTPMRTRTAGRRDVRGGGADLPLVGSRLRRPASAPYLPSSLELAHGDRLAASANRAARLALDVHRPRARQPPTAESAPSSGEPQTATEMQLRLLTPPTRGEASWGSGGFCRTAGEASPLEAAPTQLGEGGASRAAGLPRAASAAQLRASASRAAPPRLWSAPSATALLRGPASAPLKGRKVRAPRRLLSASASQPALSAGLEWRVRPGSSPAW